MVRKLTLVAACLGVAALCGVAHAHPPAAETYSITSRMRILEPVNPDVMNDEYQDVEVISRDANGITADVTYYPLHNPPLSETVNWQAAAARFPEYLRPGPTTNWDAQMRTDVLEELKQAGVYPDTLTDRELVQQVSRWAMKRSKYNNMFSVWFVDFVGGMPRVFEPLRSAFDKEKRDPSWTDEKALGMDTLGREMFYNRSRGACTSSATYLATIFRAIGIPTRIVVTIPPFDCKDKSRPRCSTPQCSTTESEKLCARLWRM